VSLRAVRLIPRSKSLTDRGLRPAASASSSCVSPASARNCRSNCLGWDCSITSQAGYRGKSGGPYCDGSACLQTFFGILAGTIPVVLATNSDPGKPLFAIVQTALHAATSPR
jgi:hypothetical protein